ncbi:DedA family protein [Salibacterium qingdaonense]|uniref:Membrane protein DedA, SNARE-associated domain n=1 Tax=Salibacterium qingdaonense TaxID=266892 RepID=A0A1I4QP49_9BACI|nr:hypothetical protein [Salibacterium qingdaonense]SFM41824.1 membrane protein DedA, SNARE-associated domain [Salibacterium qingdaonense]
MLELILNALEQLGLAGLFLGVAVEAISSPFPAAIVLLVYGYIIDPTGWNWVLLSISSAAVYTAIAYIPYWLALRYDYLLQKQVDKAGTRQMMKFMDKYREWTITAGRILGMGYIVYVAAFYRITPFRYGFFTFIGVLPVALLMLYLGRLGNIEVVYSWFQGIQYVLMAALAGLIGWYIYYRLNRRKKEAGRKKNEE